MINSRTVNLKCKQMCQTRTFSCFVLTSFIIAGSLVLKVTTAYRVVLCQINRPIYFWAYLKVPFFDMSCLNCPRVTSCPGKEVRYGIGSLQK